jgi:hypothetical protein
MLRYEAKFFWTSPAIPWTLIAATVALTIIRQRKLEQSVDAAAFPKTVSEPSTSLQASEIPA